MWLQVPAQTLTNCDQAGNSSDPVSSLVKGDSNSSYLGVVWIKTDNRLENLAQKLVQHRLLFWNWFGPIKPKKRVLRGSEALKIIRKLEVETQGFLGMTSQNDKKKLQLLPLSPNCYNLQCCHFYTRNCFVGAVTTATTWKRALVSWVKIWHKYPWATRLALEAGEATKVTIWNLSYCKWRLRHLIQTHKLQDSRNIWRGSDAKQTNLITCV